MKYQTNIRLSAKTKDILRWLCVVDKRSEGATIEVALEYLYHQKIREHKAYKDFQSDAEIYQMLMDNEDEGQQRLV